MTSGAWKMKWSSVESPATLVWQEMRWLTPWRELHSSHRMHADLDISHSNWRKHRQTRPEQVRWTKEKTGLHYHSIRKSILSSLDNCMDNCSSSRLRQGHLRPRKARGQLGTVFSPYNKGRGCFTCCPRGADAPVLMPCESAATAFPTSALQVVTTCWPSGGFKVCFIRWCGCCLNLPINK